MMRKMAKFWLGTFLFVAAAALFAPFVPNYGEAATKTMAFAYQTGGIWGMGYDYLGRPIAAQLMQGGQQLLLASLATALFSQGLGMAIGLWLSTKPPIEKGVSLLLDALLILPMTVVALVAYSSAGSSLYATIPITTMLSIPFTSRYYRANAQPLLQTAFVEQAQVAGEAMPKIMIREVVPILMRSIRTDLGQAFITAMYLLTTVSFLGAGTEEVGFLWSTMVAKNLPGLGLNPWATTAPILAIIAITVPLNLFIDAVEED